MTTYHPHTQTATFVSLAVDKISPWHGEFINFSSLRIENLVTSDINTEVFTTAELDTSLLTGTSAEIGTLNVIDLLTTENMDITGTMNLTNLVIEDSLELSGVAEVEDPLTTHGVVNVRTLDDEYEIKTVWDGITATFVWCHVVSGATIPTSQTTTLFLKRIGYDRFLYINMSSDEIDPPPDPLVYGLALDVGIPFADMPSVGIPVKFMTSITRNGTTVPSFIVIDSPTGLLWFEKSLETNIWDPADTGIRFNNNIMISWSVN